jgi:hypothetical protein
MLYINNKEASMLLLSSRCLGPSSTSAGSASTYSASLATLSSSVACLICFSVLFRSVLFHSVRDLFGLEAQLYFADDATATDVLSGNQICFQRFQATNCLQQFINQISLL